MKLYKGDLQFEKANELIGHLFQYGCEIIKEKPDVSGVKRIIVLADDGFNTLKKNSDGLSNYEMSKRIVQAAFFGYFEVNRNSDFQFKVNGVRDDESFKEDMEKIYGK